MTIRKSKKDAVKCPPLSVRVTPEELAELLSQAGKQSLSDYVRSKLFEGDSPSSNVPSTRLSPRDSQRLLAQILIQLGQMNTAKQLNELIKAIHSGIVEADQELIDLLSALQADLRALRGDLLKALGFAQEVESDTQGQFSWR